MRITNEYFRKFDYEAITELNSAEDRPSQNPVDEWIELRAFESAKLFIRAMEEDFEREWAAFEATTSEALIIFGSDANLPYETVSRVKRGLVSRARLLLKYRSHLAELFCPDDEDCKSGFAVCGNDDAYSDVQEALSVFPSYFEVEMLEEYIGEVHDLNSSSSYYRQVRDDLFGAITVARQLAMEKLDRRWDVRLSYRGDQF
jgi:hypothetical protein